MGFFMLLIKQKKTVKSPESWTLQGRLSQKFRTHPKGEGSGRRRPPPSQRRSGRPVPHCPPCGAYGQKQPEVTLRHLFQIH